MWEGENGKASATAASSLDACDVGENGEAAAPPAVRACAVVGARASALEAVHDGAPQLQGALRGERVEADVGADVTVRGATGDAVVADSQQSAGLLGANRWADGVTTVKTAGLGWAGSGIAVTATELEWTDVGKGDMDVAGSQRSAGSLGANRWAEGETAVTAAELGRTRDGTCGRTRDVTCAPAVAGRRTPALPGRTSRARGCVSTTGLGAREPGESCSPSAPHLRPAV